MEFALATKAEKLKSSELARSACAAQKLRSVDARIPYGSQTEESVGPTRPSGLLLSEHTENAVMIFLRSAAIASNPLGGSNQRYSPF